jgi:hypothetical protein
MSVTRIAVPDFSSNEWMDTLRFMPQPFLERVEEGPLES